LTNQLGAPFDEQALEVYLRAHLPGIGDAPLHLDRISGGQSNPTFFATIGDQRYVLRKKPVGELLPSAHQIDREFRVMSALSGGRVPVPDMVHYCEDPGIIGTAFYLMRRVEGRVFALSRLPGAAPQERRRMYSSLAGTLAALHDVDPVLLGLADFGRKGGYFARQIFRWGRQWELSRREDDPNIDRLRDWLPKHIPDDTLSVLTHGDYRVGNVIFSPARPAIAAVLDWELSTLGHPLGDLAHCCIAWHCRESEYGGLLDQDLAELGIPSQSEFERDYYAAVRHGQRMTPFHMAFALFRFAVVFEGIGARAAAGTAAAPNAAEHVHLARVFAARGVEVIDSAR
jgi:aminoglycoside phosphotransferase (APT) family kinase protein